MIQCFFLFLKPNLLPQSSLKENVIDKMKQVVQADRNKLFTVILESIPYGVLVLDQRGQVRVSNQLALDHLEIKIEWQALIGQALTEHLNDFPRLKSVLKQRFNSGRIRPFNLGDTSFLEKYLTVRGRPMLDGMIITIGDVTIAKANEYENVNAMLEGQESERMRLSRELHDGIGPILSTIKLHLDAVSSELQDSPKPTVNKLNAMSELLQEVTDDLRNISHSLMPGTLVDLGLVAALNNLCQKANASERVQVNFYHTGLEDRLEESLELGIFRISQELLHNAFKHAKANVINIQLIRHSDSILLMVEDDGIGFDKSKLNELTENGIGLRNIQTRTMALEGRFSIDTHEGDGVVATIEIPI